MHRSSCFTWKSKFDGLTDGQPTASACEEFTVHTCDDFFCGANQSVAASSPSNRDRDTDHDVTGSACSLSGKFFVAAVTSGSVVQVNHTVGAARKHGKLRWTSFSDPNPGPRTLATQS